MIVNLTDFSNDKYVVLKTLFEHQLRVGDTSFIPLSQQEVSIIVGFSKPKTNLLMKELIADGYVSFFRGLRGKYIITEAGHYVIEVFEKNSPCSFDA